MPVYLSKNGIAQSADVIYKVENGITVPIDIAYRVSNGITEKVYSSGPPEYQPGMYDKKLMNLSLREVLTSNNPKLYLALALSPTYLKQWLTRVATLSDFYNQDLTSWTMPVTTNNTTTKVQLRHEVNNSHNKTVIYKSVNPSCFIVGFSEVIYGSGNSYASAVFHKPFLFGTVDNFTPANYNNWTLKSGFQLSSGPITGSGSSSSWDGKTNLYFHYYDKNNKYKEIQITEPYTSSSGTTSDSVIVVYSMNVIGIYNINKDTYNWFEITAPDNPYMAVGAASYHKLYNTCYIKTVE